MAVYSCVVTIFLCLYLNSTDYLFYCCDNSCILVFHWKCFPAGNDN